MEPEYRIVDNLSREHDELANDDLRAPENTVETSEDVIFVPPDMRHSRDIDSANQELETLYSMLRMKLQEAQKLQRELTSPDEYHSGNQPPGVRNRNTSGILVDSYDNKPNPPLNRMAGEGGSDNAAGSRGSQKTSSRLDRTTRSLNNDRKKRKGGNKRSRGFLSKISGKPKKSSWRFIADMDKSTEQLQTGTDDVIDPALLKDMMGREFLEDGSLDTDYTEEMDDHANADPEYYSQSDMDTQAMRRVRKRSTSAHSNNDAGKSRKNRTSLSSDDLARDHDADLDNVDEITKFLISRGIMNLEDERYRMKPEGKNDNKLDFLHFVPKEYRKAFFHILDPEERKKALKEIYKTRIFVASYWMFAIFFVLLLLPESRFFAPFIAGYIGGRKAGNVFKGALAAMVPFMLIALVDLLVYYNFIYHFYDLYLPTSGTLSQNFVLLLSQQGVDTSGLEGSFFNPETSLGRTSIYMTVSAIIGGTLERDARRLSL